MLLSCWATLNAQHDFLKEHVEILASDEMHGRKAGSQYGRQCAAYIASQFEEIGLLPAAENNEGAKSYIQNFEKYSGRYANVVGFVGGNDPELRNEYIVIGAHYDHIGFRTPGRDTVIYNGADDNASGVAVLIETARRLKLHEKDLKRSVIFAAFDAEEIGLYGSKALADNMPLRNVKFMASIDMVGWLNKAGELQIKGTATLDGGNEIFLSVPHDNLQIKTVGKGQSLWYGSDHDSFASVGIPAVLITTGTISPYHKPQDTAEKIDYDGLNIIADYTTGLAFEMATRDVLEHASPTNRKFQISAGVSAGGTSLVFPSAETRTAFTWSAGILLQYHFNTCWALRNEILYMHRNYRYPLINDSGTELLVSDSSNRISTSAVTIPIYAVVKSTLWDNYYCYAGAGVYYSHIFGWKPAEALLSRMIPNESGMLFTAGAAMGHIDFSIKSMFSLNKLSTSGPKTKSQSWYFSLYYRF